MAYDENLDPEEEQAAAPVGAPAPALQEFQAAFTDPAAKGWAGEVSTRLNDYFQRRQLVDDNQAAGQNFVNDMDQFKSGLVSMVQNDPHALHTALDIVPPTIKGIIDSMPGMEDEDGAHHAALTGHIQTEIAAAAVTRAAEGNEPLARSLLNDPRIQGHLGEATGTLDNYIGMQAAARDVDARAQAGQAAAAQSEREDESARRYLGALVGASPGQTRSPAGWAQGVMADNGVTPQAKVDLFDAHDRLQRNGDVPSDPHALMDFVGRIASGSASQADIFPMVGANMSLADTGSMLAALKNPDFAQHLDATLRAASQQFAPHGDIAETNALGRFISWLMPQARAGTILDPQHPGWVLGEANGVGLNDFRVTGDDLLAPVAREGRPSLGQIFAGMGDGPIVPLPIAKVNPVDIPKSPNTPIGATGSGNFFQRKLNEGGGATIPLKG